MKNKGSSSFTSFEEMRIECGSRACQSEADLATSSHLPSPWGLDGGPEGPCSFDVGDGVGCVRAGQSQLSGDHGGSLEKQGVLTFLGVHFYFLFINFYWIIVSLQCCAVLLLHRRGNQPYVFMYALCFRFASPTAEP